MEVKKMPLCKSEGLASIETIKITAFKIMYLC